MTDSIQMTDTPVEAIVKMAQGNPGALTVMGQLFELAAKEDKHIEAMIYLMHMDDMGMRGPQIWAGFKDWAGHDITKFRDAVCSRDKEMIAAINKHPGVSGRPVVAHGASF